MTAAWPRNTAAKMNRPHSAVPQNFQTRGGWSAVVCGTATALAGVRESINQLSWFRHARPCAGYPRLPFARRHKTWMAGPSPAMTDDTYSRQRALQQTADIFARQ